jgi:integrase
MEEWMGNKSELSALAVQRINRRGINFVGGVTGLGLNVTATGARSWILRMVIGNKRRDMGLGGYPSVSLAQARESARLARAKVALGVDPIEDARTAKAALIAEQNSAVKFQTDAEQYIQAHREGWKSPKHAQQWESTLSTYVYPIIGGTLAREVGVPHILKILEPIWLTKTETASRVRSRIELILDWSTAKGHRFGPNPARWKSHLDALLPAPGRVTKKKHHKALKYADLPEFMLSLSTQAGIGANALAFVILTAARSGEARGAKWAEFDLDTATWTVPAGRMKAGREHRVPLSRQALDILKAQELIRTDDWVFSGMRGGPLSDMTLSAVLRRMQVEVVPHGFRSTFRDWCSEVTIHSGEVAEMALAHTVSDKVEAAYRRGDLLAKRRALMQDWSDFACSKTFSFQCAR